jgi:hypothetical protein
MTIGVARQMAQHMTPRPTRQHRIRSSVGIAQLSKACQQTLVCSGTTSNLGI